MLSVQLLSIVILTQFELFTLSRRYSFMLQSIRNLFQSDDYQLQGLLVISLAVMTLATADITTQVVTNDCAHGTQQLCSIVHN